MHYKRYITIDGKRWTFVGCGPGGLTVRRYSERRWLSLDYVRAHNLNVYR